MKVFLRLPNWIGDVIMATPSMRAVRAGFPGAEIVVAARPSGLPMLAGAPWFDRAVAVPGGGGPLAPWRLGRRLAAERFDIAILLPNSWSSAITAAAARIPRRIGYANDGRGLLLTEKLHVRRVGRLRPVPMVQYYLDLCRL